MGNHLTPSTSSGQALALSWKERARASTCGEVEVSGRGVKGCFAVCDWLAMTEALSFTEAVAGRFLVRPLPRCRAPLSDFREGLRTMRCSDRLARRIETAHLTLALSWKERGQRRA
jgi:hypothetical protein